MLSDSVLQKKYGITQVDYESLLRKQHGVCAVCKCHQRYQSLAVDHDHKIGKVRGLLCVQCNRGLGRFFDSPIRLRNAAAYIEASRQTVGGTTQTPSIEESATQVQVPPLSSTGTGVNPCAHQTHS